MIFKKLWLIGKKFSHEKFEKSGRLRFWIFEKHLHMLKIFLKLNYAEKLNFLRKKNTITKGVVKRFDASLSNHLSFDKREKQTRISKMALAARCAPLKSSNRFIKLINSNEKCCFWKALTVQRITDYKQSAGLLVLFQEVSMHFFNTSVYEKR